MPQAVEEQSTESEAKRPSDPYEQFLAAQKKRSLEWKTERDAKRARVALTVTIDKRTSSLPCASSLPTKQRSVEN